MEDGKDVEGDSSPIQEPAVSNHVRSSTDEGTGSRYELTALSREKADECLNPASLDDSEQSDHVLHGASADSGPQLLVEGEVAIMPHQSELQSGGGVDPEQSLQPAQLTELENAPTVPPFPIPPAATPPEAIATPPQASATPPRASATPSSTPLATAPGTHGREERDIGGEEFPIRSGRLSPFFVVKEESLVPAFESPGLLFAHGVDGRYNRCMVGQRPLLQGMAGWLVAWGRDSRV